MTRTTRNLWVVAAMTIVCLLTDGADAAPRRLFRRRVATYGAEGVKEIAPKVDSASQDYRILNAYYSYEKAMEHEGSFDDKLRVFLMIRDEEVLASADSIVAEVKLTDLSKQRATRLRMVPVSLTDTSHEEYKLGVFDIVNEPASGDEETEILIEPAKVYRLFVNLHRRADRYGKETVIGRMNLPYYVATTGTTRIDRARQHIAMRTFREFYYAQNGWRSGENYPMDCYAYYMWATGDCTVGAQNGRTILGRLFGALRPFNNGAQISEIANGSAIHGDYVRKPGHSFMLLAYDPSTRLVYTMEGNFNSTIEVAIRSIDPGWTVGHLVDEHVRPGLFELSGTTDADSATRPSL